MTDTARLNLRVSMDVLARLDALAESHGLKDRSEAARFAIREATMESSEREEVADRDELLRLLSDSARSGSVTAMKALLDERRRDGDESEAPPAWSAIDELAARRSA